MMTPANQYSPPNPQFTDRAVWDRINFLLKEVDLIKQKVQNASSGGTQIARLTTQVQAASDALTQLQTFVGKGQTQFTSTDSTVAGSGVGLQLAGPGSSVVITVTNAGTFRTAIGLGGMAVLNAGAAVANSAVVAGVGYVQADFQSVIDKLNALLTSLRNAGHIAP
jgi:hypothetical protein